MQKGTLVYRKRGQADLTIVKSVPTPEAQSRDAQIILSAMLNRMADF